MTRVVFGTEQKNSTSPFLLWIKRLTPLTPEMDCDQTVMGLPSVTSADFLTAKSY
jgi:hypothetical protein